MTRWIRKNLLATPLDALLTLAVLGLAFWLVPPFVRWALIDAHWLGSSRDACTGQGACWVFVRARFPQFLYGFYPEGERWRPNAALFALALSLASFFVKSLPFKKTRVALLYFVFPVIAYHVLHGAIWGLTEVETTQWGGLLVTLIIAVVGIAGSLPLGILLALARQSALPVVRGIAVVFIELWRGVPLITVLFMASVMLPLFLPQGMNVDKLLRALVGVTLFSAAYMAEVVRGGLNAIPRGQIEAAKALGLGYWQTTLLVVLPQALKKMIPGIVNTFISLFKDTTLVLVIGMFDLLGMIQTALTDPEWIGYSVEGYVFAGLVFWLFCFSMSRFSMRLERQLRTERRA